MADVQVKYTSDMQKLLRDQDKTIQKQEAQIKKLASTAQEAKKTGKSLGDAGRVGQESLGTKFTTALAATVTKLVAVDSAARLVGSAMAFVKQETDKAMASFDALDDVRTRLNQVATSAADRQQLESRADALAAKEGVDRSVVRNVLFSARSEGFEGSVVDEIIRNAKVVSPEAAAGVAGQIPSLFKGKINADESINATLAAAQSSRLSFEDIARGLPGAAEGAGLAGSSASETFALESVLASRFKSGETAADRIKAFGTKVSLDEELSGGGIVEAVKKLRAATPERRQAFLGSSAELNVAFAVISEELDAVIERQKTIDDAIATAGSDSSVIDRAREATFSSTTELGRANQAAKQRDIAKVQREIANEQQLSESGFGAQASLDAVQADLAKRNVSGIERFGADKFGSAVQLATQNKTAVEVASYAGASAFSGGLRPIIDGWNAIMGEQREAARELTAAARALSGTKSRLTVAGAARQVTSMATE